MLRIPKAVEYNGLDASKCRCAPNPFVSAGAITLGVLPQWEKAVLRTVIHTERDWANSYG